MSPPQDVQPRDLAAILDFMYHGEVNVKQDNLDSFLAVAERLRVQGLYDVNPSSYSSYKTPASRGSAQMERASVAGLGKVSSCQLDYYVEYSTVQYLRIERVQWRNMMLKSSIQRLFAGPPSLVGDSLFFNQMGRHPSCLPRDRLLWGGGGGHCGWPGEGEFIPTGLSQLHFMLQGPASPQDRRKVKSLPSS